MKSQDYRQIVAALLQRVSQEEQANWKPRFEGELRAALDRGTKLAEVEQLAMTLSDQMTFQVMAKFVQSVADVIPADCPDCGSALTQVRRDCARPVVLQTGTTTMRRSVGWCEACGKWRCPADVAMELNELTEPPT